MSVTSARAVAAGYTILEAYLHAATGAETPVAEYPCGGPVI